MIYLIVVIIVCSYRLNVQVTGLSFPSPFHSISRRDFISTGIIASTTFGTNQLDNLPQQSWAQALEEEIIPGTNPIQLPERNILLQKILSNASDEEILEAIRQLELLDPSKGKAATYDELGGTWELIYSINTEAFSYLLNLPELIRPKSLQLLGSDATKEVGAGRVAQVLDFPTLPLTFILSSGAVPVMENPSILEIFPPFRFEARLFGGKIRKQFESGSDADFRALNARSAEAQAAGRNMYKQRYLETSGKKGDLRISEVVAGDPVIVVSFKQKLVMMLSIGAALMNKTKIYRFSQ